ncbi:YecR family lipoprotein [Pantoea ananatis]|uniref:YecR family lipoprotein n=1 Tax=Pantoea ananas TaxID=553 RepID=UPI000ACFE651|nr:YecR family lipoprotein [Pantoea ananatis]
MMSKKYAILALSLIVLSGCAAKKQMVPTGGSKSDGTVRMSYSYGMFEKPVIDPQQGMTAAKARCSAWGYNGAEAFGGFTSQCSQPSSSGCMQTTVTVEYQCTGDLKK